MDYFEAKQTVLDWIDGKIIMKEDWEEAISVIDKSRTPEIIPFKAYLHGSYTRGEWQEVFEDRTGYAIDDRLASSIQDAFYEVGLECTLNTKTGRVEIKGLV